MYFLRTYLNSLQLVRGTAVVKRFPDLLYSLDYIICPEIMGSIVELCNYKIVIDEA